MNLMRPHLRSRWSCDISKSGSAPVVPIADGNQIMEVATNSLPASSPFPKSRLVSAHQRVATPDVMRR